MISFVWLVLLATLNDSDQSVDFDTQVIPILTKSGCNSGACHGAAAGRGEFYLSLLGSDPAADHVAIVQAYEGRRVNRKAPQRSLILRKPTEQVEHGGGLALNESNAELLQQWIAQGAHRTSKRKLKRLDIQPADQTLQLNETQRISAKAHFEDGSISDVTQWTVFTANDATAVDIRSDSLQVLRTGQHTIIARYMDRVVPMRISVPLSERPVVGDLLPINNFIDQHISETLQQLRIVPSSAATDQEWLRRTYLALIGRLPAPSQAIEFQESQTNDRRERVVDNLLASESFVDYWTFRLSKLLRMHSLPNDPEAMKAYADWLRNQLRSGAGWNKMASQLIQASGDSHSNGAANFGRMVADARSHAELVGECFAGIQLGCANCHNHPLDRWTQQDYHGLAAVFAKMDRSRIVRWNSRGAVTNPKNGEPATPRIPGVRDLTSEGDHRSEVVDWLVDPSQRRLARACVNRLWHAMMGRGLVEPIDDLRETNPATHPKLLDHLAEDFANHGYDIRRTLKQIALSSTFARSSTTNDSNHNDDQFYSHALHRPLEPELLLDAVVDVTAVRGDLDSYKVQRAVEIIDPVTPVTSLDILGRCRRVDGCNDEALVRRSEGLAVQLHLLNGEFLNQRIQSPSGRLHSMIRDGRSNSEIIAEFYQRALCRQPTATESEQWLVRISESGEAQRAELLEDFLWALLNSRDFKHNH